MPLISTFGSAGSQSFGTRGIQVGGSAEFNLQGDRIAFANNAAFAYGTGNFTLEAWIYPTNASTTRVIWRASDVVYLCTINGGQLYYSKGDGGAVLAAAPAFFAWNHVAVVRSSNITRIYLNGIQYGAASDFVNLTGVADGALGNYRPAGNNQFFGYITNFRISKQALYTANFTPSLLPFTRTSQGSSTTSLLLNVNSAATLATDSSASGLNGTNTNVTYSALTPYGQPYVTPPTVIVSSATVTPTSTTPTEGQTITVNVVGTNTANGTYYYSLQEELGTGALTAADFTSASLTGSFTISGNVGSFPLTITRDLLTEGSEIFTIYVRTVSTSGEIIGTSAEITIQDTSITPVFTVTPGSINEGSAGSFTVRNVGPDGTYFFTVLNGTTANADFSAVSGSFVVSGSTGGIDNGSGSFNITPVFDYTTEGAQTFQVQVRSGSTSGPVIITSNSVTINDTSLNPAVSVSSATETGFNFTTSGMSSGTFYWTINHITTSPEDFVADSGSFIRNSNNIEVTQFVSMVADYVTEGDETFTISIRTGSTSGPIIATSATVTVTDTTKTFTVTPSSSTMTEGSTITISVSRGDNLSSIPNGTTLAWSIVHGTTTAADFSGPNNPPFETPTAGLFSIGFGSGSFNITAASDVVFETDETFQVDIRFQSGALIKRSGVITISSNIT
jgi:hypothetical protein